MDKKRKRLIEKMLADAEFVSAFGLEDLTQEDLRDKIVDLWVEVGRIDRYAKQSVFETEREIINWILCYLSASDYPEMGIEATPFTTDEEGDHIEVALERNPKGAALVKEAADNLENAKDRVMKRLEERALDLDRILKKQKDRKLPPAYATQLEAVAHGD